MEIKAGTIGIAVSGLVSDRNELYPSYLMHTISLPQVNILVPLYTYYYKRVDSQVSRLCLSKMVREGLPGRGCRRHDQVFGVSTCKTCVCITSGVSQLCHEETIRNVRAISSNTGE